MALGRPLGAFGRFWPPPALEFKFGRDFRAFWAILGYSGLFWVIGLFLAALRKIFAGAVCCLLLLSWSLSSKSVLAFACCCLPGHVFASRSTELILNLNSCWLCCLLLLSLACFSLLWLALVALAALSVPLLLRFVGAGGPGDFQEFLEICRC